MANETTKLLMLINQIENGINAVAKKAPEVSDEIRAVRAVVAQLRECLELPSFAEQERTIGAVLETLVKNEPSPERRALLEKGREDLKAAGLKVDPPAH